MKNSHKSQMPKGHTEEKKPTPLLTTDRVENRLKKPTTFICKLKFRNELPDPSAQLKLMTIKRDKDQYVSLLLPNFISVLFYCPYLPAILIPLDLQSIPSHPWRNYGNQKSLSSLILEYPWICLT
jgi:RNA polymerase II-associated factor 1